MNKASRKTLVVLLLATGLSGCSIFDGTTLPLPELTCQECQVVLQKNQSITLIYALQNGNRNASPFQIEILPQQTDAPASITFTATPNSIGFEERTSIGVLVGATTATGEYHYLVRAKRNGEEFSKPLQVVVKP